MARVANKNPVRTTCLPILNLGVARGRNVFKSGAGFSQATVRSFLRLEFLTEMLKAKHTNATGLAPVATYLRSGPKVKQETSIPGVYKGLHKYVRTRSMAQGTRGCTSMSAQGPMALGLGGSKFSKRNVRFQAARGAQALHRWVLYVDRTQPKQ
jgi:hypothetical protein